ncbi:MAG: hypothetical protein ACI9AV_000688 [Sediminicola sp.]|jgi:hypothetical protein
MNILFIEDDTNETMKDSVKIVGQLAQIALHYN